MKPNRALGELLLRNMDVLSEQRKEHVRNCRKIEREINQWGKKNQQRMAFLVQKLS